MEKKFALDFIVTEKTWSFHYKNTTADGNKSYYRCNKIKLRGHQCPAGIYLLYDCRNEDVFIFRALENHDHSKAKSNHGLSDEVKREIDTLFTLKFKLSTRLTTVITCTKFLTQICQRILQRLRIGRF